jgi:sterol desaturase/sphingolipid hydroxylase (fatty acid hydroxylase superfamily)
MKLMEPERLKLILYWVGIIVYLGLELWSSYRTPDVSKARRWLANLPLSIINGFVYHLIFYGSIAGLFIMTEEKRVGLLQNFDMPYCLKIIMGVMILDFVIYVWHLLNHTIPFFWRFHRVHHSDMNMDISTANRFHFGELFFSGFLRLAVVYTFGIPAQAYILFEILVNLSIQFHHSSITINPVFEKFWIFLFVPPSMHRIHHSVKIKERDSNYGVLLSIWDRFLGTFTYNIDQEKILIGIGSHRKFNKLGFWHLWAMPFTKKSL